MGNYKGTLNNCTLVGNSASEGGGAYYGTLNNCIVFFNSTGDFYLSELSYCCTTSLPSRPGNIAADPLFLNTNAWANLRLQSNSPCINSGTCACVAGLTDLDDYPRVSGGTVDMGAYEYQSPASRLSYAWLRSFGLATDGSADYADPDQDGMSNWQEWIAGTDPTNAVSALRMLTPTNSALGLTLLWSSVTNRTFFLQRATNLTGPSPFSVLRSNLAGLSRLTSFVDTNFQPSTPHFYRVGVEQ